MQWSWHLCPSMSYCFSVKGRSVYVILTSVCKYKFSFYIKVLWLKRSTIVFVESICRVHTLSLTGKLMYFLADRSIVQWPELHAKYPQTVFLGRLV